MGKDVAVTGMGIVSAIGMNTAENLTALLHKRHGISQVELIDTQLKDKILVGEIKLSNSSLEKQLGLAEDNYFSRTDMLGLIAVKEAVKNAGIEVENNKRIGFINATTVGSMDMLERYFFEFLEEDTHRRYIKVHDAGSNTELIAKSIGLQGFVTTISTACSSAANAIMLGAQMIRNKRLDQVIVGGMDGLSKFTINGFNSLMILSDTYNQPFDENRKGLNLGEGAAYLVLESTSSYQKRGKEPIAFLEGSANANDAFHQTASSDSGDGAFLAMKNALKDACLSADEIDYINIHGTATENNDLSEGRAMCRLFIDEVPLFSSTKPYTGHTLAASAAVEAVFSILALQNNVVYPNLNFYEKIKDFDLVPNTVVKEKELHTILSNSFGFGGNCSTLIFGKTQR